MGHLSAKCPPLYLAVGGQLLYTSGRKLIDNQKCFPKFTKCQFNAKIINLAAALSYGLIPCAVKGLHHSS